ncbi:hypothetical protein NDN08_001621 [Rhodosorus marinus]|uniref:Uncharacterized protein n=1 Tax=Rhodosorus marinus TaxID=101924 RepID=A0AAV8UX43_9RHOD|nr:hypothetical protein NDN08_001621 [Rhodosorus marinus]
MGVSGDRRLWIAAVKPPIYNSVLVPILVGSSTAKFDGYAVDVTFSLKLAVAAILLLTWCNISNDVFDSMTGVDEDKKESYVKVTGSFWGCLIASKICLIVSMYMFWSFSSKLDDSRIITQLIASAVIAYLYQGPPFRLSYKGVGEILTFFAFGPVGTPVFYYFQAPRSQATSTLIVCSILVGITTSMILFGSHFHQVEQDFKSGKMSPIVRLGTTRGSQVLLASTVMCYLLVFTFSLLGVLPLSSILCTLVAVPLARSMLTLVINHHSEPEKIRPLKMFVAKFHLVFHLCVSASLLTGQVRAL